MKSFTGFIVEVRTAEDSPAMYLSEGTRHELRPDDVFVGYCWSETDPQPDGSFAKVQVVETCLVDQENRLYEYGRKAEFNTGDFVMTIRALRGPERNVRLMSKAITRKYEIWSQTSGHLTS